jgi:hypothetical protein
MICFRRSWASGLPELVMPINYIIGFLALLVIARIWISDDFNNRLEGKPEAGGPVPSLNLVEQD